MTDRRAAFWGLLAAAGAGLIGVVVWAQTTTVAPAARFAASPDGQPHSKRDSRRVITTMEGQAHEIRETA